MTNITKFPSLRLAKSTLLFGLVLFFTAMASAQHGQYTLDHTSNTSQYTSPDTSNARGLTPFTVDRKSTRSQYLYLASELNSERGQAGEAGFVSGSHEITSLAFDVTGLGTGEIITDYYVKITPTALTQLPSSMTVLTTSTVTVAYIDNLKINHLGWFEIVFDTPFIWNGTSNILVEVCKTNESVIASPTPSNVEVATTTTTSGSNYRAYALHTLTNNSSSPDGCDMIAHNFAANTSQFSSSNRRARPNIRFTFKCDGATTAGQAATKGVSNYCLGENVILKVVNGQQSSGLRYQWYESTDNINFDPIDLQTRDTLDVERKDIDMYYRRSTGCDGIGANVNSASVMVKGINKWNGTAWSMGYVPAANEPIKIAGDFDTAIHGNLLEACSVKIESGNIIVRSENTFAIKDKFKVAPTASVIFENHASLIQENNVVNEGVIKYKRNSQPVRLLDYTYWSAPVSGQTPAAFSPGTPTSKIYHWSHLAAVQNWNGGVHNLPMVAGKGYIIRAPNGYPTTGLGQVFNGEFTGVPNNGDITVATQGENSNPSGPVYWNLIGNPYPSALDADLFLLENQHKIDGTLKYWTHNSTPSGDYPGSNAFNYNSNDYATYNFTGSVGTGFGVVAVGSDPNDPTHTANTTEPGRYIAAGQSFMVAGGPDSGESTVTFKNSMRVRGENKTFFRTANAIETVEKNRIWLEMKHQDGAFKQTLVGYIQGATNGLDWGYDGKMLETSPVLIYTKTEEQNLIIQGKALPFVDTDQIPLGFSTTLGGTFDLNLFRFDGLFSEQLVYIEDTYTNTVHNLKDGNYSFNAVPGVFDDRFIIRFSSETLGVSSTMTTISDIVCYTKNNVINLSTHNHTLSEVVIYDLSGRLLYSNNSVNSSEFKIGTIAQQNQLLIVQVITEEGLKSIYKLIY